MSETAKRYSVAFRREAGSLEDISAALSFDPARYANGCDHLMACSKGLGDRDVLHFPEIGVVSIVLEQDQAVKLRADPRIANIGLVRTSISTPMTESLGPALLAAPENVGVPAWHVPLVKADMCWPMTTGRGVKIGVIDGEIDGSLAYLPIAGGQSFRPDEASWSGTDDPHGTFCAGIIGCRGDNPGKMIGIAPGCDLYALRVNKDGTGNSDYIAAALIWATRMKLDVISMSQWDESTFEGGTPDDADWENVARAAELFIESGGIVIGISGNSGGVLAWVPRNGVNNPGRCTQVVAVGATAEDKSRWFGSSYGPDDLPEYRAVEVVAPGVQIYSIYPGGEQHGGRLYDYDTGTSFAAPQVAGACALLKQLRPDLPPDELRSRIKRAAQDLGLPGRDAQYGAGFLDCLKAVSDLTA